MIPRGADRIERVNGGLAEGAAGASLAPSESVMVHENLAALRIADPDVASIVRGRAVGAGRRLGYGDGRESARRGHGQDGERARALARQVQVAQARAVGDDVDARNAGAER